MPTTTAQKDARRVLLRMMLELHALVRSTDRPTEELLVGFAVRLSQYEGRAADATTIAAVTRLPRTSVNRHLKELERLGRISSNRIGRRVVHYVPLTGELSDVGPFYDDAERIVRRACRHLTKMDSLAGGHES